MLARTTSAAFKGIQGFPVTVEVDLSKGLPSFGIVGLPDASVRESKERVASALRNSGFDLPLWRLTVNLAPAEVRKEGPSFDLSIAIGILSASGQIPPLPEGFGYLGELSLDGILRPVRGALPCAMGLREAGFRSLLLPVENGPEAAVVEGLEVYPLSGIREAVEFVAGKTRATPLKADRRSIFEVARRTDVDWADVKGQTFAKRALEVAAAGGHNALLIGPPGAGKTLLARRLPTLLPDLGFEEALEVTRIHSVAGLLPHGKALVALRPFRSPHHTISAPALVGGGSAPRPGEVSLAHRGVLFLDELPEFSRTALEVLRQPLEEKVVHVSRVNSSVSFPADFMLLAAMNPCPCGYLGHPERRCACSERQVRAYRSRVSGPLLDRMDIQVEVPAVGLHEMMDSGAGGETSACVHARVGRARALQGDRLAKEGAFCNARLETAQVRRHCALGAEEKSFLRNALKALGLSGRAYEKILKVSRTIADLENTEHISTKHLAEAVSYRMLDKPPALTAVAVAG